MQDADIRSSSSFLPQHALNPIARMTFLLDAYNRDFDDHLTILTMSAQWKLAYFRKYTLLWSRPALSTHSRPLQHLCAHYVQSSEAQTNSEVAKAVSTGLGVMRSSASWLGAGATIPDDTGEIKANKKTISVTHSRREP
jgi:hypothetical protein